MQKQLEKFLNATHSLPEGTRKFFAVAATAIFAITIFSMWMGNTSSRLTNISSSNLALSQKNPIETKENIGATALGPAAGIAESLRSLEFLIPEANPKSLFGGIEMNDAYDYYNQTEKFAKKFLATIYETAYGWTEKIGTKIYTP